MRVGLLSNAGSGRNRRGMAEIERAASAAPEIIHHRFEPGEGFGTALRGLAEAGCGLVVLNGGDGSVHGALTTLLDERPFAELPHVAILPRGTANMTAADCGLRGHGADTLERLLATARTGRLDEHLAPRHVLKVDYGHEGPVPRGMFFGAAGIIDVIRLCTGELHTRGIKGEWSHAATVIGLLLGALLRGGFEAVGLKGHEIGIRADDDSWSRERVTILVATTLDRLVLRSRPFWATGGRPVRHTRLLHPPKALIRRALRILYGGETRRLPEDGYRSGGALRLELELDAPFTIDGEFYKPDPARPVVITADEIVRFVRL